MSAHKCPITGCAELLPRHLLMCARHWKLVPADLRQQINFHWRLCKDSDLFTDAYLRARETAINSVKEALLL